MPWLTPEDIPEGDDCRPLSIPADSTWLALFGGALTELTKPYNWQEFGALTVDQTVAKMQEIIDNWYDTPCQACVTPGGYRVVRINSHGRLQEMDENGDWVDPTDEYVIPPPAPREGGTTNDKKCLAATNATNALRTLYEGLSESWNNDLSENEAITALIALAIATLGFEIAPITWAIAAFFLAVFEVLYTALRYVTADLWDDAFSELLTCYLVDCAHNDAGVITFDWDCFNDKMNSLVDSEGLEEVQLRLFVQLGYLLYFIGGVDGLNRAGGTTEITEANCDECGLEHCLIIDFRETDGEEYGVDVAGAYGTWVSGLGWKGIPAGADVSDVTLVWEFPEELTCIAVEMTYTKLDGGGTDDVNRLYALNPVINYANNIIASETFNPYGNFLTKAILLDDVLLMGMSTDINNGTGGTSDVLCERMILRYKGDIPAGWIDNCPD